MQERGFEVAVETNGTTLPPLGPDHARNSEFATKFCRDRSQWPLRLQTHPRVEFR